MDHIKEDPQAWARTRPFPEDKRLKSIYVGTTHAHLTESEGIEEVDVESGSVSSSLAPSMDGEAIRGAVKAICDEGDGYILVRSASPREMRAQSVRIYRVSF